MISLLIGVGVLFLAVIAAAMIDPRPRPGDDDADLHAPTMDATVRSI
jgi:hypothetical protein